MRPRWRRVAKCCGLATCALMLAAWLFSIRWQSSYEGRAGWSFTLYGGVIQYSARGSSGFLPVGFSIAATQNPNDWLEYLIWLQRDGPIIALPLWTLLLPGCWHIAA